MRYLMVWVPQIVAVAAIAAACGPDVPTTQRTTPTQPRVGAPGFYLPPTTDDGRPIVFDAERWWCYSNDEISDGGCGDTGELCEALRTEQIKWWFGRLYSGVPKAEQTKEKFSAYWGMAMKDFPPCTQREAYACFETIEILTDKRHTLCWPFIQACDHRLYGQRVVADLRPIGDKCSVHRAR